MGLNVAVAAPTGKAAQRASEATGQPASTIHRPASYTPLTLTATPSLPLASVLPLAVHTTYV
ncbi:AAA family ATPase [Escherichia coli]|uniref:AAA family ATPase n=1 Tax=Escherichia coli TaxID=562 RepID=UPI003A599BFF